MMVHAKLERERCRFLKRMGLGSTPLGQIHPLTFLPRPSLQ